MRSKLKLAGERRRAKEEGVKWREGRVRINEFEGGRVSGVYLREEQEIIHKEGVQGYPFCHRHRKRDRGGITPHPTQLSPLFT